MDLNMSNLWFHGKEHISDSPFPPVNFACLGSSETVKASTKLFLQGNQNLSVPDDGCRLVLGLGPTLNLHCAGNESSCGSRAKDSVNLFNQHFSMADHDLKLSISRGSTRNFQDTTVTEKYSQQNRKGIVFPVIDEGSTSAKRIPDGYMLPLLFAPISDGTCLNGTPPETNIQHIETVDDHITSFNQHKVQVSTEPSATTDCSFAATSDLIISSTNTEQRSYQRHPKRCRFNGCSKGARGATGLCISHGGGQRCQKLGCNKGAESRTTYCKSHGGGKRCQELGCTKSAEGKTEFCIAHGGGRRCGTPACTKAARGRSGFCIKHGGGKRCMVEGCTKSAEGQFGLCISHGGGRRCQHPNCSKGAQGSTMFCKSHGGGKRCIFEGCTKGAEGNTLLCKGHGGGKRCLFEGGGLCPKSVHGGTSFCVSHGGGKRCSIPGCTKSARGRTDCCVRHGGGKRCKVDGCDKSAQGSTNFCKAHGGGKRCAWSTGCERFARGRSGLCATHGTLMASKQVPESEHNGGMIRNSLFSRMASTSSTTAGNSMDHDISSSRLGASSDCGESLEDMRDGKLLIPHQVLVPGAMKPSSSRCNGQEDGGSQKQQCFGFVVPEGRVHGGGLMSMLGAGGNLDDPKT